MCRKDNESGGSCDGCDYCIASTCKSSGENRIISDSSTYEKCSDSCGGKYKCKSGYTAKYAGSNQYNCVRTSGCYYDTVAQCKTAGYTYTAEERWWMQDENMTHECEPCDCGGTEMNKCVPVGVDCSAQYKSQCDSWGGTLKSSTSYVNEDVCHAVFGQCDNKYWYCLKPGCSDDSSGDYAKIRVQRANSYWPTGGVDVAIEPSINFCGIEMTLDMSNGDDYDLSTGEVVEVEVPAGSCEIKYDGLWFNGVECVMQGWLTINGSTLSFTGPGGLDMSYDIVNATFRGGDNLCKCSARGGKNTYNFEANKTYNIIVYSATLGCNG